jgi:hypothetical protein
MDYVFAGTAMKSTSFRVAAKLPATVHSLADINAASYSLQVNCSCGANFNVSRAEYTLNKRKSPTSADAPAAVGGPGAAASAPAAAGIAAGLVRDDVAGVDAGLVSDADGRADDDGAGEDADDGGAGEAAAGDGGEGTGQGQLRTSPTQARSAQIVHFILIFLSFAVGLEECD